MDHYIDIRILPDPEFSAPLLMNALFGKLHRGLVGLVARGKTEIGISFPRLRGLQLGDTLRLHGRREALERLMATEWMAGLRDHAEVLSPQTVPNDARHRMVRRVQVKSGAARLRRRLMRRHDVDEVEAMTRIPDDMERRLTLPYVQLRSASTGQSFRLFIEHGPIGEKPQIGLFSTYGLSDNATIPWF